MLYKLKRILKISKSLSLTQMAAIVRRDEEMVLHWLQPLINKGWVQEVAAVVSPCKLRSATACNCQFVEAGRCFAWVGLQDK